MFDLEKWNTKELNKKKKVNEAEQWVMGQLQMNQDEIPMSKKNIDDWINLKEKVVMINKYLNQG